MMSKKLGMILLTSSLIAIASTTYANDESISNVFENRTDYIVTQTSTKENMCDLSGLPKNLSYGESKPYNITINEGATYQDCVAYYELSHPSTSEPLGICVYSFKYASAPVGEGNILCNVENEYNLYIGG